PVPRVPDFPAMERDILRFWEENRIFDKLRAQIADGPHWSFLDGPITANNPMGVHHAWGRSSALGKSDPTLLTKSDPALLRLWCFRSPHTERFASRQIAWRAHRR